MKVAAVLKQPPIDLPPYSAIYNLLMGCHGLSKAPASLFFRFSKAHT